MPKLRAQLSLLRSENANLDDENSNITKEIDKLNAKINDMQTRFQDTVRSDKIEMDILLFGNEELRKCIEMHRSNLNSIFQATQRLSDPTYPSGIYAISAQLKVYEARYQRQLEMNSKPSRKLECS